MTGGTTTPGGKGGLYLAAAALRLLLFVAFPGLPDLLTGRVEISTPVTSFKRRKKTSPVPSPGPCFAVTIANESCLDLSVAATDEASPP